MMKHLVLIICFLICGCGIPRGTGTGNPFSTSGSSPALSPAGQIFTTTCNKLSACFPEVTLNSCADGIRDSMDFAPKLGLSLTPTPTVIEILDLETSGAIRADTTAADSCASKIAALACSDPNVLAGYDRKQSDPFARTSGLLDSSCVSVFGTK